MDDPGDHPELYPPIHRAYNKVAWTVVNFSGNDSGTSDGRLSRFETLLALSNLHPFEKDLCMKIMLNKRVVIPVSNECAALFDLQLTPTPSMGLSFFPISLDHDSTGLRDIYQQFRVYASDVRSEI
jgi:hypothetical protein